MERRLVLGSNALVGIIGLVAGIFMHTELYERWFTWWYTNVPKLFFGLSYDQALINDRVGYVFGLVAGVIFLNWALYKELTK